MDVLDANFLISATDVSQLPPPAYAEVAFAGRSNVGKSSLINSLAQRRKLVRTSSTPGCTRGINLFRLSLRGALVDFVDLPGYGFAQRSKEERKSWGPLIEGFLRERPGLHLVIVIVDVRRGLEDDDRQLLDFLGHLGRNALVVATKLDKLAPSQQKTTLFKLEKEAGVPVLGYSSETHEGRDAVWRRILRACAIELAPAPVAEKAPAKATAAKPHAAKASPKAKKAASGSKAR